jgi:hypothetical protein
MKKRNLGGKKNSSLDGMMKKTYTPPWTKK